MDPIKAQALHRYYVVVRYMQDFDINDSAHMLFTRMTSGLVALDRGCDDNELAAIEAIAGCDYAPEWAKEMYG